jgi:hypothetical protein
VSDGSPSEPSTGGLARVEKGVPEPEMLVGLSVPEPKMFDRGEGIGYAVPGAVGNTVPGAVGSTVSFV